MAPTRLGFAVTLILVAACAGPAPTLVPSAASATATLDPTATPSPTLAFATVGPLEATPLPSGAPALGTLPASAITEFGRVRLTLDIGVNPMYAKDGTEAIVTIDNRSRRTLEWRTDGCVTNAYVIARTKATWRDSTLEVPPEIAKYRDWLRESIYVDEPIHLHFARVFRSLHREGGCADLAIGHKLAPGRSVSQAFIWDGTAAGRLGPAPNGPVAMSAHFDDWKLAGGDDLRPLEVALDAWVVGGRRDELLSPFEAIDVAIQDDRLTAWLVKLDLAGDARPLVEYDRELGMWVVGALTDFGWEPTIHAAFIDPTTAEVFAVREHRVTD